MKASYLIGLVVLTTHCIGSSGVTCATGHLLKAWSVVTLLGIPEILWEEGEKMIIYNSRSFWKWKLCKEKGKLNQQLAVKWWILQGNQWHLINLSLMGKWRQVQTSSLLSLFHGWRPVEHQWELLLKMLIAAEPDDMECNASYLGD